MHRIRQQVCKPVAKVCTLAYRKLLQAAQRATGCASGLYEVCVRHPDKGSVDRADVDARLAEFARRGLPVALTAASLYTDKAALFRGCTFAVGYDTAARIVNTKYYGNSEARMAASFAELRAAGCLFAVAGRVEGAQFRTLDDIAMPDVLEEMGLFVGIAEADFREDVSSTELRAQQAQG